MTDINDCILALLNEGLGPLGLEFKPELPPRQQRLIGGKHLAAYAYISKRQQLACFLDWTRSGELFAFLLLGRLRWFGRPTTAGYEIDLADPAFPEKAAEWVRSALSQS